MAPLAAALLPVLVCVLAPGRLLCGVLGGVRRGLLSLRCRRAGPLGPEPGAARGGAC